MKEKTMSVRLKRLQADQNKIIQTFPSNGRIRIKQTFGNPPEKYQVEYLVTSFVMLPSGSIQTKNAHLVEIFLTRSYPRQAPQCRMLTPVFHPNIAPHAVCIGDHWAAGESLPHLILRIGEMLAFQSYNLKSPLNGEAAKWVESNKGKLPTDKFDFSTLIEAGEKVLSTTQIDAISGSSIIACSNCGAKISKNESVVCASNHVVCKDCVVVCAVCNLKLCLHCLVCRCSKCRQIVCAKCHFKCSGCNTDLCSQHVQKCSVCGKPCCDDCSVICSKCGRPVCLDHMKPGGVENKFSCTRCP